MDNSAASEAHLKAMIGPSILNADLSELASGERLVLNPILMIF
jgi:hypothetical protein